MYPELAVVLYRARALRSEFGLTPAVRSLTADLLSWFQASPHTQGYGWDENPRDEFLI